MVDKEHLQRQTLTIEVFAPQHEDRSASTVFRKARDKLIKNNPDAKCFIDNEWCDHEHPLELHHQHVEWCDSNAVDWEKVKLDVPDFPWHTFDQSQPETFIDSEWNANLVLCKLHHVGKDHGIHMLPYTLWVLQRYKKKDFVFSPDEDKEKPAKE